MTVLPADWVIVLPYLEYWLPVTIGMLAGLLCLVLARIVFMRNSTAPPPPSQKTKPKEYDPFVDGSPTDQRKAYRRTGNPVPVYYALPDKKNEPQRGWVFDRSVGGVGMLASEELAPGLLLGLRPTNAPQMTPWLEVEVRSCRQVDDGYEIGCKFIKTPPWSILLMYG